MPWQATKPEQERMRFVALWREGTYSKSELCARFGISRPTGDALLRRWEEEGIDGLKDRSRRPKHSPQRISQEMRELLLETRKHHKEWGPRTIVAHLKRTHPGMALPAPSTVGDLFSREGVVERRRRTRGPGQHPGRATVTAEGPNDLWATDFKGEFRTRDGQTCYPLTVTDASSRYLLGCQGLTSNAHDGTQAVFTRLFREYGLPAAIRSDNGVPFSSRAIAGLSKLNVWWTKLGIVHDRIAPGHPEQNASHERMHRTLKQATLRPPAETIRVQQARFDAFRQEFNNVRPHHALEMDTPASRYAASPRKMPRRLAAPEYPGHCVVRRVRANGIVYFRDRQLFLSEVLIGESVAFEEIDDGIWSVLFYNLLIARLDERTFRFSG